MNSEHTPGPLVWLDSCAVPGGWVCQLKGDGLKAEFWGDTQEIAETAARLHLAAADLLAALENMMVWADRLGMIAVNCGAIDRTVALDSELGVARAAVAKARGVK